jgi:hypothetical protein
MVHLSLGAIIAFSFLAIIRDSDAFSSYLTRIETFSVAFPVSIFILANAVNRFLAVSSTSAKSLS